jgi:hypothetical protein
MLHNVDDFLVTENGLINIKNIKPGQKLINHQSAQTQIIDIKEFSGDAFELKLNNGQVVFCKENDKLVLIRNKMGKDKEKYYKESIYITPIDYINQNKTIKKYYKLRSSECIQYAQQEITIDPYFLGILLGDGSLIHSIGVTSKDKEVIHYIYDQAVKYNLKVNHQGKDTKTYYLTKGYDNVSNKLLEEIKHLYLHGTKCHTKFIPYEYKVNSEQTRLELLAGLIDSDGSNDRNTFCISTKSNTLADDICFVSRSLGFRVSDKPVQQSSQTKKKNTYRRLIISGNTNLIPTKIQRKQCHPRILNKNHNIFSFTPNQIQFNGYELITDGQYMNKEFVIHSSS